MHCGFPYPSGPFAGENVQLITVPSAVQVMPLVPTHQKGNEECHVKFATRSWPTVISNINIAGGSRALIFQPVFMDSVDAFVNFTVFYI